MKPQERRTEMRDSIDFVKDTARFTTNEAGYIVDVLRGAYAIMEAGESLYDTGDSDAKLLLGDYIQALDDSCNIEIVDDDD
jgi:hypothetical protein